MRRISLSWGDVERGQGHQLVKKKGVVKIALFYENRERPSTEKIEDLHVRRGKRSQGT